MPWPRMGLKLPLVVSPTAAPSTSTGLLGARRAAALGGDAAEAAGDAALLLGLERRSAAEVALVPAHHPAEAGLQRRDARAELVAVQRQAGLEPQRVAGAEARPARCRRRGARPTSRRRLGGRHGDLDAVLARCSRCRPRRRARPPTSSRATWNRPTAAASGNTVARRSRAAGPAPRGSPAWPVTSASSPTPRASRTRAVFEAFGMTSKRSSSTHHTMMSSSTEASAGSSRWVYCARPGADPVEVVGERRLQAVEGVGSLDPHGAEVADVEAPPRRCGTPCARRSCRPGTTAACPTRRTR